MTSKLSKYSIVIIAAILLATLAFAGAASADGESYTAAQWNALSDSAMNALSGTVYIADSNPKSVIYPKFNSSTGFTPCGDLTLDFTNYLGTFYGEPNADSGNKGALFGFINLSSVTTKRTITIKNLSMSNVKIAIISKSSVDNVGGIVGCFKGNSQSTSILNVSNCHLQNSSFMIKIRSQNWPDNIGGLIGYGDTKASINFDNCSVIHCDINGGSLAANAGGLIGNGETMSIIDCYIAHCTISTTYANAGGLAASVRYIIMDSCIVENTSVYGKDRTGGLIGTINSGNVYSGLNNCNVSNCIVVSTTYSSSNNGASGGLIGYSFDGMKIIGCTVKNTTIVGHISTGGVTGKAYYTPSQWNGNKVENIAVNGSSSATASLICGSHAMNNPSACIISGDCFINNNTKTDNIILNAELGPDFWRTISWAKASSTSPEKPIRIVTS